MKKERIKIYFLEILLLITTFFAIFSSNYFKREYLAIFLTGFMIVLVFILKKKKIVSLYKKQVILLFFIFAIIYLGIFYLVGMYSGFKLTVSKFSLVTIKKFILPLSFIIVSSEIIRYYFVSYSNKNKLDLSMIFTYISMVNIDILVYLAMFDKLSTFDEYLTMIGFVTFSSLSCNILYNYVTKRYGFLGIIVFRLMTSLYAYIIPLIPDVYIFIRTLFRIIYPYFIYIVIFKLYSNNSSFSYDKNKNLGKIVSAFSMVIMVLIVMLVSCKFKYGILIIGSGSMTGTINKGDAVIFEKYDTQMLKEGQVIVFDKKSVRVVHRIIEIKNVNGELRIYTKGDANPSIDDGFRTKENVLGISNFRVKYIGLPTLFVRDLFTNKN